MEPSEFSFNPDEHKEDLISPKEELVNPEEKKERFPSSSEVRLKLEELAKKENIEGALVEIRKFEDADGSLLYTVEFIVIEKGSSVKITLEYQRSGDIKEGENEKGEKHKRFAGKVGTIIKIYDDYRVWPAPVAEYIDGKWADV